MASSRAYLDGLGDAKRAPTGSGELRAALFAPLDQLLSSGGDERLALVGPTGLNNYGCKSSPRPEAISFSSCTASSISQRAYAHAGEAQLQLAAAGAIDGFAQSFDARVEQLRRALRAELGLEHSGAEIVFSPSGTDSQLQALLLTGLSLGTPLTCIVVGSDQTGSGTAYTSGARHFASRTARGNSVAKGSHIATKAEGYASVEIPFASEDGSFHTAGEMDALVTAAVAAEIAKGRKVLLQAMHASKFGWRAPSDACLADIAAAWQGAVQIVVDACQMRLSPARIADYLARDYLVLFTGSKFFGGPPLSGGLLVPKAASQRFAAASKVPDGLAQYCDRSDLPAAWQGLRSELSPIPNFGQWLRWEAALCEIRAYHTLPVAYRDAVISGLAHSVPMALRSSHWLQPLAVPPGFSRHDELEDEFAAPTIFPFLVRDEDGMLGVEDVRQIHRALNRDLRGELKFAAFPDEYSCAEQLCHIGQPVAVSLPDGRATAALRIAVGSRTLFDASSPDGVEGAIARILADVENVVAKINLVLKNRPPARLPVPERPLELSYGQ
jgi:hypothetical protein